MWLMPGAMVAAQNHAWQNAIIVYFIENLVQVRSSGWLLIEVSRFILLNRTLEEAEGSA
jgi:hypothetical protein